LLFLLAYASWDPVKDCYNFSMWQLPSWLSGNFVDETFRVSWLGLSDVHLAARNVIVCRASDIVYQIANIFCT